MRSWSLRAGDAIALDSRTLHATGPGALPRPFRRVSTRWAPTGDAVRRATGRGTAAFWDLLPHGLVDGDPLAGDVVPARRARSASAPCRRVGTRPPLTDEPIATPNANQENNMERPAPDPTADRTDLTRRRLLRSALVGAGALVVAPVVAGRLRR